MSQIDLDGRPLPVLTAATGTEETHRSVAPTALPTQERPDEGNKPSWLGRALESAVYGVLVVPFAIVVCAVVAFAILPLHNDSRCDDGYE